jgi:predicted Ser/Thr protein kinase
MTVSTKAGRYELMEEIGRGAMGVVYRANDPVIGRAVAVKTMRLASPGNGLSHEDLISRFQTEARAAGRLTHPNIVVVYDAGEEDGVLYLTMELVEGTSLLALIEARQTFPLPRILRIMEQACSALDFAHQHKIVHRDIKPANLMLAPDDTLKITDFGTAKILQFGAMQTAQTIGTPSYMSPEQIKGRPVDGRSDIFSLGVVLYELATGQKPFPGDSVTTVIYKIVNENPVPPRELDSSIHPGLSAVITKALAKPVEERFQSCREFVEALQNFAKYQSQGSEAEATVVMPRSAMPKVTSVDAARMSSARGAMPARPPATGRTQHPVFSQAASAKRRGTGWLVVILLALIGAAGYQVSPALQEVWQRSQPDRAAAENALRSAALTAETATSAPAKPEAASAPLTGGQSLSGGQSPVMSSEAVAPPVPAPASATQTAGEAKTVTSTPAEKSIRVPLAVDDKPQLASSSKPIAQPAENAKPTTGLAGPFGPKQEIKAAPIAAGSAASPESISIKETPASAAPGAQAATTLKASAAPANSAPVPYKPERLPPTPAAANWQTRIWRILVQSGIDGQVQAVATGNTITLTGTLRLPAHRRLLDRLQDVPDRIHIIDDIDYAAEPSADAPTETPNSAGASQGPAR